MIKRAVNFFALLFLILVYTGCSKEIPSAKSNATIQYNPFGERMVINQCFSFHNAVFSIVDTSVIVKSEGPRLNKVWETVMDRQVYDLVNCSNGELLTLERPDYWSNLLLFSRLDANGKILFSTPNTFKLFPNAAIQLLEAVTDNSNGMFILASVNESGNPEAIYLFHINEKNETDLKFKLTGQYRYMAIDPTGELYLMRNNGSYGFPSDLTLIKTDINYLMKNNVFKTNWSVNISSPIILDRDYTYFPFKLVCDNDEIFFFTNHLSGIGNLSNGIDCFKINSTAGSVERKLFIPINQSVENYLLNFYPLIIDNGLHLVINYEEKAAFIQTDGEGKVLKWLDLSGTQNACKVSGIAEANSLRYVFGKATNWQSPSLIPFWYLLD